MDILPNWAQVVLTLASGGFFGSLVSLIISPIAAKQQIRQLEVTYRYKLHDNLLETAKQHRDILYIPINKCLSKIDESYEEYKDKKNRLKPFSANTVRLLGNTAPNDKMTEIKDLYKAYRDATEVAMSDLQEACLNLTLIMRKAIAEGNDTYLPMEFDNRLHSFLILLQAVHAANLLININHIDIQDILEVDSKRFNRQFVAHMRYLKAYIKSIMQGTTTPDSYNGKG